VPFHDGGYPFADFDLLWTVNAAFETGTHFFLKYHDLLKIEKNRNVF
jgi:hypothetical protein